MNTKLISYLLASMLKLVALMMLPPFFLAIYLGEPRVAAAFGASMAVVLIFSLMGGKKPKQDYGFFARDGLITVGLVWVAVSFFGALPFWLSGQIPGFIDALFESVSGFTTTGASVLADVEGLSQALALWRSISHFTGGLGVLVFVLAVVPMADSSGGGSLHLLRAESTGPQVSKLLPKMRDSAKMLYIIYVSLTALMFLLLVFGGVSVFDSVNLSFSTAGTGGFGIRNDSLTSYSAYAQAVAGVFMVLFGVNFNVFFLLIIHDFRRALGSEEVRVYLGVVAAATALVAANLVFAEGLPAGRALGLSAFQVAAAITSTGFSTVDYNLWPEFSKMILLGLMVCGSCAGSTGGGIKMARIIILFKSAKNNMMRVLRPRQVSRVRMDGASVDDETVQGVLGFLAMYCIIASASFLLISLDNFSMETSLTAVLGAISNAGPAMGEAGPMGSYAGFSAFSKLVLSLDMLLGRLGLFPMLLLFSPAIWKKTN